MNLKKFLGLPIYLKLKQSKVKKDSLVVNPSYDFTLYVILRSKDFFALAMDENFNIKFISTQKYINVEYKFEPNIDILLKNQLENPELTLSEDFFNYFQNSLRDTENYPSPSICLYEKFIINSFVILKPEDESKGYWVDTEIKIYLSNTKTKFKETVDVNDTRTVYSNFGTLKSNTKNKNLYLSMKRVFNVKKENEVLASEIKF
jgi:hypothetical protein